MNRKITIDEVYVDCIEDQILLARKIHAILEVLQKKSRLIVVLLEEEVKVAV